MVSLISTEGWVTFCASMKRLIYLDAGLARHIALFDETACWPSLTGGDLPELVRSDRIPDCRNDLMALSQ